MINNQSETHDFNPTRESTNKQFISSVTLYLTSNAFVLFGIIDYM